MRGPLLIQLIDRKKHVWTDMEGNPVAKAVVAFVVKRRSHRCCIDRRVICPQGPNQSVGVHRVVKKGPDVSLTCCCGRMQQCTAVVGRVFSAWLRACKSPVAKNRLPRSNHDYPTPQRAASGGRGQGRGEGTPGALGGQGTWTCFQGLTWHCIPWKRFLLRP